MKKLITKISTILAVALGGLLMTSTAFAGSAHWSYPGAYGATAINIATGPNAITQSKKYGASNYQVSSSVQAGDSVAVLIYFHNDGDAPAQNVTFKLTQPTGSNTSFSITGTTTESGGATSSGTTTINIGSAQTLTYISGSIRLYKNNQWTVASSIPGITDGSEIFNQGVNIGSLPGKNECPANDPVCYQGSIAVGFTVSQGTSTYQCNNGVDDDNDGLVDYPQDPGCTGPTDDTEFNQTQQQCTITSFYASPTNVQSGGNTTLYWNTSNCTSVTVDGISYPVNGSGNFGPLYNNRTYIINATNGTSSDTKSAFVTVNQNQNQCDITSFYASPSNVQNGGYTTLYWNSTGCNTLTIDGISYPVNGSGSFGPIYSSRTYYAYASGAYGSDNASAYVSANQQQNQCQFTSFYASPTNVQSGGYTTLYWNTTNCTSLSIDGVSYPVNGSGTFGPLYSSRTYYATAYGYNGSDTRNAYVTVNQVNNTYQCNDGRDNDGDGLIDYPNDRGCDSPTDNDEYNTTTIPSVLTVSPTNITQTSAQLNGIATNAGNYQGSMYFEWGRTTSLGNRTSSQTALSTGDVSFYDTITGLSSNTVYYYRAVLEKNGTTYRGDIKSFITLTNPVILPPTPLPPIVINRGINLGLGTNLVQLKFQDQFGVNGTQNVCVGNVASWTLFYKNISGNNLNNVILHIDLPKDIAYRSSSGGIFNQADNSLTFSLGTLNIDQEGFITVTGEVLSSAAATNLLVMTATLSFENPVNSARETAVAYGLMNAGNCQTSRLAGLALFGSSFWPTSLIGWLILILILLALIWVIRALIVPAIVVHKYKRVSNDKRNPYYEEMDVPTAPYRE